MHIVWCNSNRNKKFPIHFVPVLLLASFNIQGKCSGADPQPASGTLCAHTYTHHTRTHTIHAWLPHFLHFKPTLTTLQTYFMPTPVTSSSYAMLTLAFCGLTVSSLAQATAG